MLSLSKWRYLSKNAADADMSTAEKRKFNQQHNGVGLGRNDISASYLIIGSLLAGLYYFKQRSDIVQNYYQYNYKEAIDAKISVVGQVGLNFFTSMPSVMGAFNLSTPGERDTRERDFINFVNKCGLKSNAMIMNTELISKAAGSQDIVGQTVTTDCKDQENKEPNDNIAWWQAKYDMISLFTTSDPIIQYLPVSFYIYGSDLQGSNIIFGGPVKSITVEADKDVTNSSLPQDGVAFKMVLEVIDTSWTAESGTVGKNQEYRLVINQQNDKCLFTMMVYDENGKEKPYNIFISKMTLRLESEPVSLTDNMFERFNGNNTSHLAMVSFFPARDLSLSYALRCMPYIDGGIVWDIDDKKNTMLIGTHGNRQLPLEVHLHSDDEVDEDGNKFIAKAVKRVLVRYGNKPPIPGDLTPDATQITSIQFILMDGDMLAQDADLKTKWIYKGIAIPAKSTVDLLFLSYTPTAGNPRTPGMSNGASSPLVNGLNKFKTFQGVRQGLQLVSIDEATQMKIRAHKYPAQSFDDIRISYELENLRLEGTLADSRLKGIVGALALILLLGWKFSRTMIIARGGWFISVFTLVNGLFISLVTLLEYLDNIPKEYRPYEPLIFALTALNIFVCIATVLYASRYVPETSPSFMVAVMVALLSVSLLFSLQVQDEANVVDNVHSFRLALLLILVNSLFIMSLEIEKISLKAKNTGDDNNGKNKMDAMVMGLPNTALLLNGVMLMLVIFCIGSNVFFDNPIDSCDDDLLRQNRANAAMEDAGTKKANSDPTTSDGKLYSKLYEFSSTEKTAVDAEVKACTSDGNKKENNKNIITMPNLYSLREKKDSQLLNGKNKWSDLAPVALIITPLAFAYAVKPFIGMMIGRFSPSRIYDELDLPLKSISDRVEDNRIPRTEWILKSLTGLGFLLAIIYLLVPDITDMPNYCVSLENLASDDSDESQAYSLLLNTNEREKEIVNAQLRFNCIPREYMVLMVMTVLFTTVSLISWVTPSTVRLVSTRTSASKFVGVFMFGVTVATLMTWIAINPKNILNF